MDSLCTHTQRVSFCSQGRGGGEERREREKRREPKGWGDDDVRLGVLRPRSTSNDTISALRFCPKRLSPLPAPFLLAAVDALDSLFSPFHYRVVVVSFSIPLRSVARASETTRKRGGRTGLGERDGDGGRIEIRTARHQTPAIRLVLKRREKDGKRSGSVRRGRIVGTNERRGGERGPKGDAKETTKRSNAKMASERILGQGLSPVPSEITRPMRALPSSFLSSISLRCFLPPSLPPLSLFHPYAPCVIYCNFITRVVLSHRDDAISLDFVWSRH